MNRSFALYAATALALMSGNAFAAANVVVSNPTNTVGAVTQAGPVSPDGGNLGSAMMYGDLNRLSTLQQLGSNNVANFSAFGNSNITSHIQRGDRNSTLASAGSMSAMTSGTTSNFVQDGTENSSVFVARKDNVTFNSNQKGSNNKVNAVVNGAKSTVVAIQEGDRNETNVDIRSGTSNVVRHTAEGGHDIKANVTQDGSLNEADIKNRNLASYQYSTNITQQNVDSTKRGQRAVVETWGSEGVVNVTQTGGYANDTTVISRGLKDDITVKQQGFRNDLVANVDGVNNKLNLTQTSAVNNKILATANGTNGQLNITQQGYTAGGVWQSSQNNLVTATIHSGDRNKLNVVQNGSNNESRAQALGNSNSVTLNQSNTNAAGSRNVAAGGAYGTANVVTVNQTGTGNNGGARASGINNNFSVSQSGTGNSGQVVTNAIGDLPNNNVATLLQNGTNNHAEINFNGGYANIVDVGQVGNGNAVDIDLGQAGPGGVENNLGGGTGGNFIQVAQRGNNNGQIIHVDGGSYGNKIYLTQAGNNNQGQAYVDGSNNILRGNTYGTYNTVVFDVRGNGNTGIVNVGAPGRNVVGQYANVTMVGNSRTMTVTK